MNRKTYPAEFKEQSLSKARERGSKTLKNIADELNLSLDILKNWFKESAPTQDLVLPTNTPTTTWSAAQRLSALLESHAPYLVAWLT